MRSSVQYHLATLTSLTNGCITLFRGFFQVIQGLSEGVFWGSCHQRDLLIVLARRWDELAIEDRRQLEARFLRGPTRHEGEEDDSYKEHLAWAVLQRLQWLRTRGCAFSFDVEKKIATRRTDTPNWRPEYAEGAAESREARAGCVATDTEYGVLLREPIESVLAGALALSGRSGSHSLKTHDPFAGLCAERHLRIKDALLKVAKHEDTSREGHVQSLAYLILSGWLSTDDIGGSRWVTSGEFRDALLHGDDSFRSYVLWQFERGLRDEKREDRDAWQSRACEFFKEAWPHEAASGRLGSVSGGFRAASSDRRAGRKERCRQRRASCWLTGKGDGRRHA